MPDLEAVLAHVAAQLDQLQPETPTSRFAGQEASESFAEKLAQGSVRVAPGGPTDFGAVKGGLAAHLKAMAEGTGSTGGYLVPPEISDELLRLIRSRSAVMRLGPRIVEVKKQLSIVSVASGASAGYTPENALIPTSELTFAEGVLLVPKALTALVPVSNRLLEDADNPAVEEVIRSDLAEVLALRADLAFLRGSGAGSEPIGITNATGINTVELGSGDGATPGYDDLLDVLADARNLNAPFQNPGWIFNPRLLQTLAVLKDADGRYLQEAGLLEFDATGGGGKLLNFPFRTTGQIPTTLTVGSSTDCSEIIFSSDWQECWIGEQAELRLEISREASYSTDSGTTWNSAFQQDQSLFRAIWRHDLGLRRPGLFWTITGARP